MAGVPHNEMPDDSWEEFTGEAPSLGQAHIVSPLPGGGAGGGQFGPGEDIHPVHIPMMPASPAGGPKLEAAKVTLHSGEAEYKGAGDLGFDVYKSASGKAKVYYHYTADGEPWFAKMITSNGEQHYDANKVNFPPPSGIKTPKLVGPPTLHIGEPNWTNVNSANYNAAGGGKINYNWSAGGKPWFADYLPPGVKYNEEGHKTYGGDSLHSISWPKVPSPEVYKAPHKTPSEQESQDASDKFNSLLSERTKTKWPSDSWRAYADVYEKHHAPFSQEEKDALKRGASSISGKLWKDDLRNLDPDRLDRMKLLDLAMDKSSIPQNLHVWSGVNDSVWRDFVHMDPGEIYLHKGFMSNSLSRDTAANFVSSSSGEEYNSSDPYASVGGTGGLLRVHVPEGSRGIILGRLGPMREEHEVQLPRGTLLRKMTSGDGGPNGIIDVEVVPGLGAFHGSHAQFDKFDLSKAGSGEGTAHLEDFVERPSVPKGGFLAQNEKVGDKYRAKLAEEKLDDPSGGYLYKIHVKAEPKELFDWNERYSGQSPHVRAVLDKMQSEHGQKVLSTSSLTGKALLDSYSPSAIEDLQKHGVKGIRFLDKRSREAGYGTQNYVIFDDNIMQIIGKREGGGKPR